MDVKFSGQLALFYFLVFLDFSNFYPLFPPHSCHSAGQHFSTFFNQTRERVRQRGQTSSAPRNRFAVLLS